MEKVISNVQNVMEKLNKIGVKTKEIRFINKQNFEYSINVEITDERYFEVAYKVKEKQFVLATTFSNQELTDEYLTKLMNIRNLLNQCN